MTAFCQVCKRQVSDTQDADGYAQEMLWSSRGRLLHIIVHVDGDPPTDASDIHDTAKPRE